MRIQYTSQPKSRQKAKTRALHLKQYLEKHVGGKWETRVWENLGWCLQVSCGSLCIYPYYYALGKTTFRVLNAGPSPGVGYGYSELEHASFTAKRLPGGIRRLLKDQREWTIRALDGYRRNSKLKGYKTIPIT